MGEPKRKLELPQFDASELFWKWFREHERKKTEHQKAVLLKMLELSSRSWRDVIIALDNGAPLAPVLKKMKDTLVNPPTVKQVVEGTVRGAAEQVEAERDRKAFEDLRQQRERSTDPDEQKRLEKEMLRRVLEGRN